MFGRLPWLALERRMRALRFLVFFDIGVKAIGQQPERHKANLGWAPHVIANRIGLAIFVKNFNAFTRGNNQWSRFFKLSKLCIWVKVMGNIVLADF